MAFKVFIFVLITFATTESLKHDDLIIAVGDQLEFLSDGTTHRRLTLESYNASKLSALAYDSTTRKLFFSDRRHLRGHIFSVNLGDDSHQLVEDIIEKTSNETVESLTYDPVEQMLLWTDGLKRSIRRVKIDHDHVHVRENSTIELVHFLEKDDKPRGLVSDPCTRMLYWTNRYMPRPTIERSRLDGSMREIIVQKNLTLPHALDLDVQAQKLYWADNLRSGYFHIERSFVNGSGREIIYRGIGQFIVSLSVGEDFVYWSDYDQKKLWSLPKDGSSESPILLTQYIRSPAMSLVVFRHKPLNCDLVPQMKTYEVNRIVADKQEMQEVTPSYEDIELCVEFCYNNGQCVFVKNDLRCSCPAGFSGDRCEVEEKESNDWNCYALVGELGGIGSIALISMAITCLILLTTVIILTVRLWRLTGSKRPRVFKRRCLSKPNKLGADESSVTSTIQDLENCCNSFTMCERPAFQCPQQANNALTREKDWIKGNDTANLLRYEF